jgi:hypothetical protein
MPFHILIKVIRIIAQGMDSIRVSKCVLWVFLYGLAFYARQGACTPAPPIVVNPTASRKVLLDTSPGLGGFLTALFEQYGLSNPDVNIVVDSTNSAQEITDFSNVAIDGAISANKPTAANLAAVADLLSWPFVGLATGIGFNNPNLPKQGLLTANTVQLRLNLDVIARIYAGNITYWVFAFVGVLAFVNGVILGRSSPCSLEHGADRYRIGSACAIDAPAHYCAGTHGQLGRYGHFHDRTGYGLSLLDCASQISRDQSDNVDVQIHHHLDSTGLSVFRY